MNANTLDALTVFISGYAKRLLESQYDALANTPAGQSLRGVDGKAKYAIEAVLYALMTYGHQKLPESSPLWRLLKDLLLDLPPEVAKRMFAAASVSGEPKPTAEFSVPTLDVPLPAFQSFCDFLGSLSLVDPSDRATVLADLQRRIAQQMLTPSEAIEANQRSTETTSQQSTADDKTHKPTMLNGLVDAVDHGRAKFRTKRQDLRRKRTGGP